MPTVLYEFYFVRISRHYASKAQRNYNASPQHTTTATTKKKITSIINSDNGAATSDDSKDKRSTLKRKKNVSCVHLERLQKTQQQIKRVFKLPYHKTNMKCVLKTPIIKEKRAELPAHQQKTHSSYSKVKRLHSIRCYVLSKEVYKGKKKRDSTHQQER